MREYNSQLKLAARELRKNMTTEERQLWSKLRMKQLKNTMFTRQKPLGGYIVDFYCHKARLVVEVDGGGHFNKDGKDNDAIRDEFMKNMELKVLRFTNSEVSGNIESVVEIIKRNLP